jgi:hypothetical protein
MILPKTSRSRMGLQLLTERRSSQIAGVLSCYDRMLIQGTLPGLCYAEGMTGYLYAHQVRIFDYPRWAQPLREALRENAERLAAENRSGDRVNEASTRVWSGSFPPWSRVPPIGRGTTRRRVKRTCAPTTASACITTSISSTRNWDCATCVFPPGVPSGCRFISTGIIGWLVV